jgi:pSer/pThr/pTyr-binding forkhead associated (FHA) protein
MQLIALTDEARHALGGKTAVTFSRMPFRVGRENRSMTSRLVATVERRLRGTLPVNDLFLLEPSQPGRVHISREHFEIARAGGDLLLMDRKSACGTIVGDLLVGDGGAAEVVLKDGDIIVVGSARSPYRYQFRESDT